MTWQWILAGLMFFIPGAAMVAINYCLIFKGIKNAKLPEDEQERLPSGAPLYGGIFCAVGVLIALRFKHPWTALIPLLIDPGGISGLAYAFISEWRKK